MNIIRRFLRLLERAKGDSIVLSTSDLYDTPRVYGFWLGPAGQVVIVRERFGHKTRAFEIIKFLYREQHARSVEKGTFRGAYETLRDYKWIRGIIDRGMKTIYISGFKGFFEPTLKQQRALKELGEVYKMPVRKG